MSNKELSCITINLICAKLFLLYPRELIKTSGTAAWIEMLYVTLIALALFFVTQKFYTQNKNVIELANIRFGRVGRVITGVLVIFVLFCLLISVMRIFSESVKIVLLQDTDTDLILGVFVVCSCVGALFGVKAISKITAMVLPVVAVLFVGFLLFLSRNYRIENLVPLFGLGFKSIFLKGIRSLYVFSDIIILNLLIPHTQSLSSVKKSGFFAILVSGFAGVLICLAYALIFPYPASEEFIMPVYQLTRIINLSSFFNRFEALFQFAWSILILLYGAMYIYIISYAWQLTFSLKYKKPLMLGTALAAGGFALVPDSIMSSISSLRYFEIALIIIAFGLPIAVGCCKMSLRGK